MIGPKIVDERTKRQIELDEHAAYELVTLRDANVCVRCMKRDPMFGVSRDHRRNRSQGGETVPSNLQLLCGDGSSGCHHWKGSRIKDAYAEGYAVPGYADPHEWPGRRWVRDAGRLFQVWVLYHDDGKFTEISDREAQLRMKGEWP